MPPFVRDWPLPLIAGVLFLVLWIPAVFLGAAAGWLRDRMRPAPISDEPAQWFRGIRILLILGLPFAVVFALLFVAADIGGGWLLAVSIAAMCIALVVFLLPRLQRW